MTGLPKNVKNIKQEGQQIYGDITDEQFFEAFHDGLESIIPDKLQEIMIRQDELLKDRQKALRVLNAFTFKDAFDEWFCYMVCSLEFAEYDELNRELKYWLRLAAKTSKNEVWEKRTDAKVSQEQINVVCDVPLEEVFEGKLHQSGNRLRGPCPFHNEKTASFFIFTDDNHFYCFGCHEHGDVIDFYMKLHELGFHEAIKALLNYG